MGPGSVRFQPSILEAEAWLSVQGQLGLHSRCRPAGAAQWKTTMHSLLSQLPGLSSSFNFVTIIHPAWVRMLGIQNQAGKGKCALPPGRPRTAAVRIKSFPEGEKRLASSRLGPVCKQQERQANTGSDEPIGEEGRGEGRGDGMGGGRGWEGRGSPLAAGWCCGILF